MTLTRTAPLYLYATVVTLLLAGFLMAHDNDLAKQEIVQNTVIAQQVASRNRPARLREVIFHALESRVGSRLSFRDKRTLASVIVRNAVIYNADPALIMAVIETESSYRTRAVSRVGAIGLMQVRPFVARGLSDELNVQPISRVELYGPDTNVMVGSYYLTKMLRRFGGDLTLALEAYNQGPTALRERLSSGLPPVGRYTTKVLKARERIKRAIASSSV